LKENRLGRLPIDLGKMTGVGFTMPRGEPISNIFGWVRDWSGWPTA